MSQVMGSVERELLSLLNDLRPSIHEEEFVFISLPGLEGAALEAWRALALVREVEGITLVVPRQEARSRGLPDNPAFRCITLGVESGLEAVGLTAAVSTVLAGHGIAANFFAGVHHDHVLVPSQDAVAALALLEKLARDPACYALARPAERDAEAG